MPTAAKTVPSRAAPRSAGAQPARADANRGPSPRGNRATGDALRALGLGGGATAPPLAVGARDAAHEREADQAAQAMAPTSPGPGGARTQAAGPQLPLRDSPWRPALQQHLGTGEPLDVQTRGGLPGTVPANLEKVRVHRDARAQHSSAALGAQAWTLGTDVFLGAGAPPLQSPGGQHLLAHELAHVLQQSHPQAGALGLSPAPYQVQRQPVPPVAAPTYSVTQSTYLGLVNQALATMAGRFVQNETLAATVQPILQAMLASVTWKDAQGNSQGGGPITHTLSGGTALSLHLILNDAASSNMAGEFAHTGSSTGVMEIFIQRNPTADDLAETLYHEAMHLVSWLINRTPPALALSPRGRAGPRGAAATLDLSTGQATRQMTTIRMWLDTLAQSVNSRRGSGAQISAADLDRMTRWLLEEVNVRIETEVFRLASMVQTMLATRGPQVLLNPSTNWTMNATSLDLYVFEFSRVFLPTDRAGLTATDRQTLATLLQILEGIFNSRVNRRFNPSPYMVGRGLPRAPVNIPLAPLTPPPFTPLPLP
jgi:hypothetical protein